MNHGKHNYHQLLRQFEQRRQLEGCTPLEFLTGLQPAASLGFQLEVIAVDIELSLTRGIKPTLQSYLTDFPFLVDEIPDIYAELISTFVQKFSPVRSKYGALESDDDYEILEEINRGGMGVIYHAIRKSIGRHVAMKVLFLSRKAIFTEAKNMAKLSHRNICRIYDVGTMGDFPFMAMQMVYGQSLKKKIEQGRIGIPESVRIVTQMADALATAHRANIVHFDVKPDNIIVNVNGQPSLTDFGLARKRSEISLDVGALQPASPVYCAPEQLSLQYGERSYRSDIYSLGLVLYECLTGRRVHRGDTAEIIDQLKYDPPRRPRDYDHAISPNLEAVCLTAIKKQPENRFATMYDFRDALKATAKRDGYPV